ncbi:hypothetical protein FNV43_RR12848 [Rhamnella rubrinervis]|uniref:Uncharacterized protein n=1 Tax=Rhamnella rubrinervis TaxID=2594499 RepID=A0A8K0MEA8_9ROSA|nr:hypothetical protein FNV43_RR12848 [Rhamnella rubrinervis]
MVVVRFSRNGGSKRCMVNMIRFVETKETDGGSHGIGRSAVVPRRGDSYGLQEERKKKKEKEGKKEEREEERVCRER